MSRGALSSLLQRVAELDLGTDSHGYDAFGLHRAGVVRGCHLLWPLYHRWFRVQSSGATHIPIRGPVILAANHSGTLPFDACMIWLDVLAHGPRTDLPRVVIDHFVPTLPFVNTLFSRGGAVGGSRQNVRWLLSRGGLVVLFPEGVPGISKPFSQRYCLTPFREGHVELAIRHQAPIVPVAIIGAEEQMPQLTTFNVPRWARGTLPIPHVPVPLTLMPLPVRYHIYYGEPLRVSEGLLPTDANDPDILADRTAVVQNTIQEMVHQGLEQRRGVFG